MLVTEIDRLLQNEALSGDELRASLLALIKPFRSERRPITCAMATLQELGAAINDLSCLLNVATELEFNMPESHPLAEAFAVLDIATDEELPFDQENVFGRLGGVRCRWRSDSGPSLLDSGNRIADQTKPARRVGQYPSQSWPPISRQTSDII